MTLCSLGKGIKVLLDYTRLLQYNWNCFFIQSIAIYLNSQLFRTKFTATTSELHWSLVSNSMCKFRTRNGLNLSKFFLFMLHLTQSEVVRLVRTKTLRPCTVTACVIARWILEYVRERVRTRDDQQLACPSTSTHVLYHTSERTEHGRNKGDIRTCDLWPLDLWTFGPLDPGPWTPLRTPDCSLWRRREAVKKSWDGLLLQLAFSEKHFITLSHKLLS